MNVLEIKGSLFDLLSQVQEKEALLKIREFIEELIKQNQKAESDGWSDLPPEFQDKLMNAYNDFKNGKKGIPHEEVMRQINERIKKYPK